MRLIAVLMAILVSGCANLNKRELTAPCASIGGDCGPSYQLNQIRRT